MDVFCVKHDHKVFFPSISIGNIQSNKSNITEQNIEFTCKFLDEGAVKVLVI